MATPLRTASADRFYVSCAILISLVVFAGFARTYYLKFVFGTPSLPWLLHVHGIVMTAWIVLFLTQVGLVSAHRVDLHRRLGMTGGFLAALIVTVGAAAAIRMTRRDVLIHPNSDYPLAFLALQLLGLLLVFSVLVVCALLLRRRPEYHKRLMLLAFLRLLPPAVTRLPLSFIQKGGIPVIVGVDVVAVILVSVVDTIRNRRLHPALAWGGLLLVGSDFVVIYISGTTGWLAFAKWLIS
jgi:hypothetical protein